jgi:hypothetical protein
MRREISFEDQEWFLHTHSQRFADAQFAELDERAHPCSATEDFLLTVGYVIFVAVLVLAVIAFKVL